MDKKTREKLFNIAKINASKRLEKLKEKYYCNPNKCKCCSEIIPFEKRFNKFNNSKRKKKCKLCLNCENIVKNNMQYCSVKCQHEFKWKKWKNIVREYGEFIILKNDTIIKRNGDSNCKLPKKYLIELVGHRCEICGTENWLGKKVPLVFDHIDGNSNNWKINNCRLVCGNCDMQLDTYKSKNKKSARIKKI